MVTVAARMTTLASSVSSVRFLLAKISFAILQIYLRDFVHARGNPEIMHQYMLLLKISVSIGLSSSEDFPTCKFVFSFYFVSLS